MTATGHRLSRSRHLFDPTMTQAVTFVPHSNFGVINTLVNTNNNTDKFFADNTGTGLARQIQLFFRFKF